MIYITQINVCDVCGNIESTTKTIGLFKNIAITYPEGWMMLLDNYSNDTTVYCPDCYEKHKSELDPERLLRGYYPKSFPPM